MFFFFSFIWKWTYLWRITHYIRQVNSIECLAYLDFLILYAKQPNANTRIDSLNVNNKCISMAFAACHWQYIVKLDLRSSIVYAQDSAWVVNAVQYKYKYTNSYTLNICFGFCANFNCNSSEFVCFDKVHIRFILTIHI